MEWLRRRLRHWVPDVVLPEMHDLQEVHDMAQNMAEIWKEQYRQRFLQEGRLEGRQEGRQEGEFGMLSRLLTRRFGALPEAVVARMRSADSEQLELWGERVLDASSLDDVFR
ncbi:DUF4351 domain-containing protein [Alcanivorax sp. S71-1-4]|uniref:DUF4351 domain-containing protein n=1 Tax=Alcanivorax sp. S71-1-4 TaxID=1177159 RepID=UPI001F2958A5|nr:DUF4351 domain-containing protein [Alcanivorax sp. S71-1-4]